MKKFGILAMVLVLTAPAYAQSPRPNPPVSRGVRTFDCSKLKGKPFICLVNRTDEPVISVSCEGKGFFGGTKSNKIELPGGQLPPHTMAIVEAGRCTDYIEFGFYGAPERRTPNKVDTENMTMLEVPLNPAEQQGEHY